MTAVDLIALHKRYSGRAAPVLADLSLSVAAGELVALLGPSGAGKSTLLKVIAGLERPDAGDVRFDGVSILNRPPNKRGAVFMFQKAYLFPFLSVADNIGFGLKVKGHAAGDIQREVGRMLDLIGLPGIERRRPAQLSGGEQQRVALARALVTRPNVLLLDEPLSSLDTAARQHLQSAIRRLQRALAITTILVTHDLDEAMAMADRMAVIQDGALIGLDVPQRLFQRPSRRSVAGFMGISTFLSGRREADWLETVNGRLHLGPSLPAGHDLFAIRPEHITVQAEPGPNSWAGVVVECVFRGEHLEYTIAVGELVVRARLAMPAPLFAHGASVYVDFPAEHLFAIQP